MAIGREPVSICRFLRGQCVDCLKKISDLRSKVIREAPPRKTTKIDMMAILD